jgi:hypothetical protein
LKLDSSNNINIEKLNKLIDFDIIDIKNNTCSSQTSEQTSFLSDAGLNGPALSTITEKLASKLSGCQEPAVAPKQRQGSSQAKRTICKQAFCLLN